MRSHSSNTPGLSRLRAPRRAGVAACRQRSQSWSRCWDNSEDRYFGSVHCRGVSRGDPGEGSRDMPHSYRWSNNSTVSTDDVRYPNRRTGENHSHQAARSSHRNGHYGHQSERAFRSSYGLNGYPTKPVVRSIRKQPVQRYVLPESVPDRCA